MLKLNMFNNSTAKEYGNIPKSIQDKLNKEIVNTAYKLCRFIEQQYGTTLFSQSNLGITNFENNHKTKMDELIKIFKYLWFLLSFHEKYKTINDEDTFKNQIKTDYQKWFIKNDNFATAIDLKGSTKNKKAFKTNFDTMTVTNIGKYFNFVAAANQTELKVDLPKIIWNIIENVKKYDYKYLITLLKDKYELSPHSIPVFINNNDNNRIIKLLTNKYIMLENSANPANPNFYIYDTNNMKIIDGILYNNDYNNEILDDKIIEIWEDIPMVIKYNTNSNIFSNLNNYQYNDIVMQRNGEIHFIDNNRAGITTNIFTKQTIENDPEKAKYFDMYVETTNINYKIFIYKK
jgi:hypothetical protein